MRRLFQLRPAAAIFFPEVHRRHKSRCRLLPLVRDENERMSAALRDPAGRTCWSSPSPAPQVPPARAPSPPLPRRRSPSRPAAGA